MLLDKNKIKISKKFNVIIPLLSIQLKKKNKKNKKNTTKKEFTFTILNGNTKIIFNIHVPKVT